MKEDAVEAHLHRRVLDTPGGRSRKLQAMRGWPDRLILLHGQVWFVELKRPKGGRFEPLQRRIGAWLISQGYNYVLLKTKEEVDTWLDGL